MKAKEVDDYYIMSIPEMRKHEWIVSWSGGKDSTATILLMHQFKVPIKKIIYVRMMWDDELPATLPIMTTFVDKAKVCFENMGYEVEVIKSIKTAKAIAENTYKKSIYPQRNGKQYGITSFMRGMCMFTGVKQKTIHAATANSENEYHMIGIAYDEKERYHNLTPRNQSIMISLGIREDVAMQICVDRNMLSPLYGAGLGRDGCWFCPNMGKAERNLLKAQYPELKQKIYNLIEMVDFPIEGYKVRNNWLPEYESEKGFSQSQKGFIDK